MSKFTWSEQASVRFWAKVDKTSECWIWTGSIGGHGYGTFYVGPKKYTQAHRFSYVEEYGDMPSSVHVDHICRNRRCVNPSHLRAATHKQNVENHGGPRQNSKSGVRGVYWQPSRGLWQAQVTHERKTISRRFKNRADAESWVISTRNELHSYNDNDRKSA